MRASSMRGEYAGLRKSLLTASALPTLLRRRVASTYLWPKLLFHAGLWAALGRKAWSSVHGAYCQTLRAIAGVTYDEQDKPSKPDRDVHLELQAPPLQVVLRLARISQFVGLLRIGTDLLFLAINLAKEWVEQVDKDLAWLAPKVPSFG